MFAFMVLQTEQCAVDTGMKKDIFMPAD